METGKFMTLEDEDKESTILSRNSKITEMLKLCIEPKNNKELTTIVSNFWKRFEDFTGYENFCEFDVCCMYAFDYVYKHNIDCLPAVSRSVYAYLHQSGLVLKLENRNRLFSCSNDCFLTDLRTFQNFDSEAGVNILALSTISTLMNGNVGFAHFLVKFGLIDFPSEVNEKSRKMTIELL